MVDRADDKLWRCLVNRYHDLGDRAVIGAHLKYLAYLNERPVGALLWGRAALKPADRDRFIGWARRRSAAANPTDFQGSHHLKEVGLELAVCL